MVDAVDVNIYVATIYILAISTAMFIPVIVYGAIFIIAARVKKGRYINTVRAVYMIASALAGIGLFIEVTVTSSPIAERGVSVPRWSMCIIAAILATRIMTITIAACRYVYILYSHRSAIFIAIIVIIAHILQITGLIPVAILAPTYLGGYTIMITGDLYIVYLYMSSRQIGRLTHLWRDYYNSCHIVIDALSFIAWLFLVTAAIIDVTIPSGGKAAIGVIIFMDAACFLMVTDGMM